MHPYVEAVLAGDPLNYWQLGADGNPSAGAGAVALTGATAAVPGPLLHDDLGATSFDGVDDCGQVALDLSALTAVTIEYFLKWDTNAQDDDLVMEFTPNANTNNGGFYIDQNNSGGAGTSQIKCQLTANGVWRFSQPTAGVWHHYMVAFRRGQSAIVMMDGAPLSLTQEEDPASQSGTFANSMLNLMSRNKVAIFGAGDLAHLAIYEGDATNLAEAHFEAASAEEEVEEPEPEPDPEGFDDARLGWRPDSEGSPLQRNHGDGK